MKHDKNVTDIYILYIIYIHRLKVNNKKITLPIMSTNKLKVKLLSVKLYIFNIINSIFHHYLNYLLLLIKLIMSANRIYWTINKWFKCLC